MSIREEKFRISSRVVGLYAVNISPNSSFIDKKIASCSYECPIWWCSKDFQNNQIWGNMQDAPHQLF